MFLRSQLEERPTAERAIRELGEAVGVSRSTLYRSVFSSVQAANQTGDDLELRDAIQKIALEMRSYGYRPVTKELHRQGLKANHKRVLRLMREDNLLCLRLKAFVRTTDSEHDHRIYPNLAKKIVLSNINQLWVADITYIRLQREFIYLAVILDAFSRRCIGHALSRRIDAELAIQALQMALNTRSIEQGLVHHSDRGVQYASKEYVSVLKQLNIQISMSRSGNPYDNAKAERFIRTLKYEEIHMNDYETLTEVWTSVDHFIESVYNRKRLHSAIGYLPPAEFERSLEIQKLS